MRVMASEGRLGFFDDRRPGVVEMLRRGEGDSGLYTLLNDMLRCSPPRLSCWYCTIRAVRPLLCTSAYVLAMQFLGLVR